MIPPHAAIRPASHCGSRGGLRFGSSKRIAPSWARAQLSRLKNMEYRSIARDARIEHDIQRSRFIGLAYRVFSLEDFGELVRQQRREHPDAAHVCTAAIVGDNGEASRSNDDGEPSGTAGSPMLQAILRQQLTDVGVIVVRYFGGIKLGAGGLVRAYAGAASDALEAAGRTSRVTTTSVHAEVSFSEIGKIENALRGRGLEPVIEYGASASLQVEVDGAEMDAVRDQLGTLGIESTLGDSGYREIRV